MTIFVESMNINKACIIIALFRFPGVCARQFPNIINKKKSMFINEWAALLILILVGCVCFLCVISVRKSTRIITANVLHTNMMSSELHAYKQYEKKTPRGVQRRKSIENKNVFETKRAILQSENKNHQASIRAQLIANRSEDASLPPSTRDVKHFVESMEDESDMEPCRVRSSLSISSL
jgi:hypothetical protein